MQRLRHMLTVVLRDIFELIHGADMLANGPEVTFPAMMDPGRMRMLFQDGILTYDSYKMFLAQLYEMDEAAFEPAMPQRQSQRQAQ